MTSASARISVSEPEPGVLVSNGRLCVHHWETAVPEIVQFFEERMSAGQGASPDPPELLTHVLRVGVLALRSTSVSVNVDLVEREFQRLVTRVEQGFDQRVQTINQALDKIFAEDGALARALTQYLGEGGRLEDLFAPNRKDNAVGRIRDLLAAHLDGEGSTLHKLLDLNNPQSPLRSWRQELREQFDAIKRQLEDYRKDVEVRVAEKHARTEALEKSALKGMVYEDLLFEAVSRIAKHFGDSADRTGSQPGIGGAKTGDVVVTINPRDTSGVAVRIVFEAKDKPVGLTAIARELDNARQNRDGAVAIAVYSNYENMPAGTGPFHEYGANLYLILYDKEAPDDTNALQLAYRAARYWLLRELIRAAGEKIDPARIRESLEEARKLLATFTSIKTQLTQVKSAVTKGTDGLDQELAKLRDGLQCIFDQMDASISAGNKGASQP